VERAFSVLKNTWQFLDRPILLHDLKDISNRVIACLLLHNILVTNRVIEEASAVYNYRKTQYPSKGALDPFDEVQQPADLRRVQNAPAGEQRTVIGINNAPLTLQAAMTRSERFAELKDLQRIEGCTRH
jgi:hypothetical protein